MKLQLRHAHCIGIGGIGVSAVARLLHTLGTTVSGSDAYASSITDGLVREGMRVHVGTPRASILPDAATLVIYSNAVRASHPELKKARRRGIQTLSYPQFLGLFMRKYQQLVVAGTHGKSTTTGMLASIFLAAGQDPMVVVGTQVKNIGSNVHVGMGRHFIVEGDEFHAAFHEYYPTGLILNNIEPDHLDYYGTEAKLVAAFTRLVTQVVPGGVIVAHAEDARVEKALKKSKSRVITFGRHGGDYYIAQIEQHGELTRVGIRGLERFDFSIRVPGEHNALNALGAAVLAMNMGISISSVQKGLLEYAGSWRRFEIKGEPQGVTLIDDYAHHPTEIKATLRTIRQQFPGRRVWCVFQPHSTHRTKSLFDDFSTAFRDCDQLILTDIYLVAGRESRERLGGKRLAEAVRKHTPRVRYISQQSRIARQIARQLEPGDVVVTMGAGTITQVADQLLTSLAIQ